MMDKDIISYVLVRQFHQLIYDASKLIVTDLGVWMDTTAEKTDVVGTSLHGERWKSITAGNVYNVHHFGEL